MTSALKGIKVLDLCHLAPGMFCTMILSDFGAEVLRVERPEQAGGERGLGDSAWSFEGMISLPNRVFNRNKKSISLNLKSQEGREIFYELAKPADVIVEGFRPGVTKRLGVDYETIAKINPGVVYCSLSGYGQSGPYAELPGHDLNYIAMAGVLDMIGERNGPPVIPMNIIGDWAGASLNATIGILIAIMARRETERGQYIDLAYTDGIASLMMLFAFDNLNYGTEYPRGDTPYNGGFPGYGVYETRDGKYISIGCTEPEFWQNLCHFVGRDDFLPYHFAVGEKREEVFAFLRAFFLARSRDEWFELIKEKNIPVAKVNSIGEALADPQMQHGQILQEITLPDGTKERTVGVGIKLLGTPGEIKFPAPIPGQDTKTVLLSLGYSEEVVRELHRKGSVVLVDACAGTED